MIEKQTHKKLNQQSQPTKQQQVEHIRSRYEYSDMLKKQKKTKKNGALEEKKEQKIT